MDAIYRIGNFAHDAKTEGIWRQIQMVTTRAATRLSTPHAYLETGRYRSQVEVRKPTRMIRCQSSRLNWRRHNIGASEYRCSEYWCIKVDVTVGPAHRDQAKQHDNPTDREHCLAYLIAGGFRGGC
jgi:hypothetical protein